MEKCFIANLKGGDLFAKDGKEFIVLDQETGKQGFV